MLVFPFFFWGGVVLYVYIHNISIFQIQGFPPSFHRVHPCWLTCWVSTRFLYTTYILLYINFDIFPYIKLLTTLYMPYHHDDCPWWIQLSAYQHDCLIIMIHQIMMVIIWLKQNHNNNITVCYSIVIHNRSNNSKRAATNIILVLIRPITQ